MSTNSSAVPARVRSVNVARPVLISGMGYSRKTAIDKKPATGDVRLRRLGLDGDDVGDPRYHGGVDQAVYAFAGEDLDLWSRRLGRRLPDGVFGENLTTVGIDVNEAVVGECWRVGSALLQVCSVRIPCNVFKRWLAHTGCDASRWVRRFTKEGRPGPYLRVLEEGVVRAGDPVVVESRPEHGITVATMFRAMTTERALLPELLRVDAVPESVRTRALEYVAALPAAAGHEEPDADVLGEGVPEPV